MKTNNHFLVIIILVFLCSCNKSKDPYPYTFYRIENFYGTDVEDLAEMVRNNDTIKMHSYIMHHPDLDIDTHDRYFGYSLLMWAIFNDKYEAFLFLLKHGADANFQGKYHNETPLVKAAKKCIPDNEQYCKYCLELVRYGADVNKREPILKGVGRGIGHVRVLVENGADLTVGKGTNSPGDLAILYGDPVVAEYLICEHNAVLYNEPYYKFWDEDNKESNKIRERITKHLEEHPELKQWSQKDEGDDSLQIHIRL